jgi:hypothetical protein
MEEFKIGVGFVKDTVDVRDYKLEDKLYGATVPSEVVFKEIDLRKDECMPDTYESQGAINSCVPYSWTKTLELEISRIFKKKFRTNGLRFNNSLSKKFLYYGTRFVSSGYSDDEMSDSGASFRYTAKALMQHGICIKALHPETSDISLKPSFDAAMNANLYKINAYYTVTTLQGILASLDLGLPVQIGTDINGFDDARNISGLSAKSDLWNATTPLSANHGMVIVGTTFKNNKWMFIIGNSYGKTWGDNGYCYIDAHQMWNYNIAQSMVIVMDVLVSDLDKEDEHYLQNQKLPNSTIILGKFAFDLNYANDAANAVEINDKIVASDNHVFVKTASGEIFNNATSMPVTLEEVLSIVGSRITYKDNAGVISNLNVR